MLDKAEAETLSLANIILVCVKLAKAWNNHLQTGF